MMRQASIDLRHLQAGDAPALLAFYNGLSPATIRTFRPLREQTTLAVCEEIVQANSVDSGHRVDIGAWHGEALVGWGFLERLDSDQPQLGLGVTDALQGQGLGRALLDQLLSTARLSARAAIYLIVVNDNQRAISLYKSCGFVIYDEQFDHEDQVTYFYMKNRLTAAAVVEPQKEP